MKITDRKNVPYPRFRPDRATEPAFPFRDRLTEIRPCGISCRGALLRPFFNRVVSVMPSGEPEGFFHDLFRRLYEWRNFSTRAGDMFSGRLTLPEHGYPLRENERNTDARHSLSRDFPETFPPGHIRSTVSPFGTDDPASIDWSQKLADPASLMSGAQIDEQIVNRFDGNPPRDRMGRPLSGEQADSVVARWPEKVREMSPDARDIAFADRIFRKLAIRSCDVRQYSSGSPH